MSLPSDAALNPDVTTRLTVRPMRLRAARRYVAEVHRHNDPPKGWLYGCAAWAGDRLVGVGIAGRPTGRGADDGVTMEITRVCTDGTRNACSLLYGRLSRAAFALGYQRVITYTLLDEPGTSLRAAGFTLDGETTHEDGWDAQSRPRVVRDLFGELTAPLGRKNRWVRYA